MTEKNSPDEQPQTEANPKLAELAERLSGCWRVTGPDIAGDAEYKSVRDGRLLVGRVTVVVDGTELVNLQHLAHDQETGTLQARYLDSLGNEARYTWALDGRRIRVSLVGRPDTYFEARFNDDYSEYAGTWQGPDGAAEDRIVYTRTG